MKHSQAQSFYFIRHGETDWNSKLKKLQGHTDIPLNEVGLNQAKALKDLVKPFGISQLICSDLSRAFETAKHLDLPIQTTASLREINLGAGEGKTWDELDKIFPAGFREAWQKNNSESLDMRFTGGESRREVTSRIISCIEHFLPQFPNQILAFVSHGFVIRSLVYHFGNVEAPFLVPNCGLLPFKFEHGKISYTGPQQAGDIIRPLV